jgi:hypothetical protein
LTTQSGSGSAVEHTASMSMTRPSGLSGTGDGPSTSMKSMTQSGTGSASVAGNPATAVSSVASAESGWDALSSGLLTMEGSERIQRQPME